MSESLKPDPRTNRDRRAHPRTEVSGGVEIFIDEPVPAVVRAELIESSLGGFRAVHDSRLLEPGLVVRCNGGRARVVWTHILQNRRVSGFVFVAAQATGH